MSIFGRKYLPDEVLEKLLREEEQERRESEEWDRERVEKKVKMYQKRLKG